MLCSSMTIWLKFLKVVLGFDRFQNLVRKRAFFFADKQIKALDSSPKSYDELASEAESCIWAKESANLNFTRGYRERWSYLGARDAYNGICRTSLFRNHGYNQGWYNQILSMQKKGWSNEEFQEEASLMQAHYWGKISSGDSDDYYSLSRIRT